jgi:uncharacterized membrane protein
MEFIYPGILFGLFALALPVVIHLFNFKRHKTVYFSNIELLRNIKQQTNKTNKLKHLIILLLRLLLIFSLVISFAQPYFPSENQLIPNVQNLTGIYIDNSKSMQSQGDGASLFDQARQGAKQLISETDKETRFVITENNFLPKHNFTLNGQEATIDIDDLPFAAPPSEFSQIIRHFKNLKFSSDFEQKTLYFFSDFQKSIFNQNEMESDTSLNLVLVQSESSTKNNVYIDSCWFSSPVVQAGFVADLIVRIKNAGTEDIKGLPVQLKINDIQKSVSNIDIEAGKHTETKLQLMVDKPGIYRGLLSINDYPIVFDDDLYFSFTIAQQIKVLEINQLVQNYWLKTLFEQEPLFKYESRNVKQLDFQGINDFNLIIINELTTIPPSLDLSLKEFVKQGGNLVILPGQQVNAGTNTFYRDFGFQYAKDADTSKTSVFKLNDNHFLFKDIFVKLPENADLPVVIKYFPIQLLAGSSAFSLMEMLNGNPFLLGNQFGLGQIYAFAFPFNEKWSNFSQNNLFVPLMYKMSFINNSNTGLYAVPGQTDRYTLRSNRMDDQPFRIVAIKDNFEIIPENRFTEGKTDLIFHGMIPSPGFYNIMLGDSLVSSIAFNENRKESVLEYYNETEVMKLLPEEKFKSVTFIKNNQSEMRNIVKNSESGRQLWKFFIILALIFMFAEGLLLRLWK